MKKLDFWAPLMAQTVKNLPAMQETQFPSLGQKDPLEKRTATHSSILFWRIPWTVEPDGLQFLGLQRVHIGSVYILTCSVAQSCLTLQPHGLQHTRFPYPSQSPRVCSNSCPLNGLSHLILCHPLLLLPSTFSSIRVFSNESVLHIG